MKEIKKSCLKENNFESSKYFEENTKNKNKYKEAKDDYLKRKKDILEKGLKIMLLN